MKLLVLAVFFVGFTAYSGQVPAVSVQAPVFNIDIAILDALYKTYDEYKDDFINYLPQDVSANKYRQVLYEEQTRLKKELDSLSYKNDVLFSKKSLQNMGIVVGSVLGALVADWLIHEKLVTTTFDIASQFAGKKERERLLMALSISDRPFEAQGLLPLTSLTGEIRNGPVPAIPLLQQLAGTFYGRKEDLTFSAYLTLYQLATKALAVGAAVGGIGLAQDIKAFKDKKKVLSEQYDKCTKMLQLLNNKS